MVEQGRAAPRTAAANAPSRPSAARRTPPGRAGRRSRWRRTLAIARAEALDRCPRRAGFGRRHQGEAFGLAGRALVGGVEAAHALDLVAEEIEPQRLAPRRPGNRSTSAAAHRIFAGVGDGVGALVAERVQLADQRSRSIRSPSASRRVSWRMRNGVSSPLGRGVGGGDQQLRLVALACSASASPAARP
jgi:hypothetical protein